MVSDEIILKIFDCLLLLAPKSGLWQKFLYTDHNFAHKSMTLLSILGHEYWFGSLNKIIRWTKVYLWLGGWADVNLISAMGIRVHQIFEMRIGNHHMLRERVEITKMIFIYFYSVSSA